MSAENGPSAQPSTSASWAFTEGYMAGLKAARAAVIAAPTMTYGERLSGLSGGFPRVRDEAVSPDGDPSYVRNTYALRDAILSWIDGFLSDNAHQSMTANDQSGTEKR